MILLSAQSKNRKRRTRRRSKTDSSWIDESEAPKRNARKQDPRQKAQQLNAQIGAIETFLAFHQEAHMKKEMMKRNNILPPLDQNARRKERRKMTLAARRRYLAERNRTGLRFLFLFCLACGIGWWLIFSGI